MATGPQLSPRFPLRDKKKRVMGKTLDRGVRLSQPGRVAGDQSSEPGSS